MTVMFACKDLGEGMAETRCYGSPRPLASLLRETNYASLTTECLTMSRNVYGTEHEPTTKCFSRLLFSTVQPR